jgi:hypothetical protein
MYRRFAEIREKPAGRRGYRSTSTARPPVNSSNSAYVVENTVCG